MKVYLVSDTHFGHGNIIKYTHRPFLADQDKEELARIGVWHDGDWKGGNASTWRMTPEAVRMMDDELIAQINGIVGADDVLWHLGDFAMPGRDSYERRCREYRDRINCRTVNIVWGNHDKPHKIRDLFHEACDMKFLEIPGRGKRVVLCHYAMAVWDGSHRGNLHLYGHSHATAEEWLDRVMPNRRSMDVGVDNVARLYGTYRPLSVDEVFTRLGNRSGVAIDHHKSIKADSPPEEDLV